MVESRAEEAETEGVRAAWASRAARAASRGARGARAARASAPGYRLQKGPDTIQLLNEDGVAGSTPVADHTVGREQGRRISEPQCSLIFPPLGPSMIKPHLQSERKRGLG